MSVLGSRRLHNISPMNPRCLKKYLTSRSVTAITFASLLGLREAIGYVNTSYYVFPEMFEELGEVHIFTPS